MCVVLVGLNMTKFSEFLKNKTADFFIIDIEDPKSFNRRMIIDDLHFIGANYDDYEVIRSNHEYYEHGFCENEKHKNGLHIVLKKN